MTDIALVLLNFNGAHHLERFLPGIVDHSRDLATMYIIDNASTDHSVEFIENNYPDIKLLRNKENLGFAGGYNAGLKDIDASYYLLVNTDIEVTEHWIQPLLDVMAQDSTIACCQPKIKALNNRSQFEYAGAAGGYIDKYGYPFCRGRIFDSVENDAGQYNDIRQVFWASGACLLIRADLFHQAGGFDASFFAHMEEIDLCWRWKNQGYKVMYCGTSTVYHLGGGTLSYSSPVKTFLNFRNNLVMLHKNWYIKGYFFRMIWRFVLDGVAALKFLLSGQLSHFVAVIKAHFSFYGRFGHCTSQRRLLRRKVSNANQAGTYQRSIVADYFLRANKSFQELDSSKFKSE